MKEKYNNFLIYTGVPNRDNVLRILQEGRHIDTAMKLAPWNKRTCMSGLTTGYRLYISLPYNSAKMTYLLRPSMISTVS